jgi:hypothetical protein
MNTKVVRSSCVLGTLFAAILGWGFLPQSESHASPANTREATPAPFPKGRYILGGGKETATGEDVFELKDRFRMRTDQYILSGGPNPTDEIIVDDDLEIRVGDQVLFLDDDRVCSTEKRGKQPAKYQGFPIILRLDVEKKLTIRITDHCGAEAIVSDLWLHRWDGSKKCLTKAIKQASTNQLPNVFFDQDFDLKKGFEAQARPLTTKESVIDLPEHPPTLLPRNRDKK